MRSAGNGNPGSHIPQLRAAAAAEAQLDGRLADSAWRGADSLTDFRQRDPAEGEPGTERTVVRVLSTSEALYVGVWAEDRNVRVVRAAVFRRDADLTVDDYITILIDSFHDRRGAFLFRTNPNGAMWDAQLTGSDNLNESWNGIWEVAVARNRRGGRRNSGSRIRHFASRATPRASDSTCSGSSAGGTRKSCGNHIGARKGYSTCFAKGSW